MVYASVLSKEKNVYSKKLKTGLYIAAGALGAVVIIAVVCLTGSKSSEYCPEKYNLTVRNNVCVAEDTDDVVEDYYILYGNTANVPQIDLTALDSLKEQLYPSVFVNSKTTVNLYSVTPSGELYDTVKIDGKSQSLQKQKKDLKKMDEKLKAAMEGAKVSEDGAQYLEAILDIAGESDRSEKSAIYVIGSGLSDGGMLNFVQTDLLNTDTDVIIEYLANKQLFEKYSLKGLEITWVNIGLTSEPQDPLTAIEKKKVEEIYKSVLNKLGAKVIFTQEKNAETDQKATEYKVGIVETIEQNDPIFEFSDEAIGFVAGTANFKDVAQAEEALMKVVNRALSTGKNIVVTGYMSNGQCNYEADKSLSGQRAEAVKNILVENGVSESRITVVNGGVLNADECKNGKYDSEIAQTNRKVIIEFK